MELELVTPADVVDARQRLSGIVRATPVVRSSSLSQLLGRDVLLKPEYRQRTGSFKIRGAFNLISRLPAGTRVVAASAGNHAQGVALAASLSGLPATIFMPRNATLPKVQATEAYGAAVELVGDSVEDAIAAGEQFAVERGATFVPPFSHPLVIAGQGTVGLEIMEEAPSTGVVVVPVGGGGLVAGISAALSGHRPRIRVVGVEASGAACMRASLDAGHPVRLGRTSTMADGIAVRAPSELTLAHVRSGVDEVVTVGEADLSRALLLLLERAKAVVEPAGAAGLAALLSGAVGGTDPVTVVLSGGNIDPLLMLKVIDHGLSAAGRYLILRIVLDDRPGVLAALAGEVAAMGLNVLDVEHHRAGLELALDEVEVVLTLETRDPRHRGEVVDALRRAGYRVDPVR